MLEKNNTWHIKANTGLKLQILQVLLFQFQCSSTAAEQQKFHKTAGGHVSNSVHLVTTPWTERSRIKHFPQGFEFNIQLLNRGFAPARFWS